VPHDLTPGDGQDVLARFKECREHRDPDLMLDLFAEDAEYRSDPFETPLSGPVAIREHWNRVAAEQADVEFDAERVWVSGRAVLASWHAAYTLQGSGDRLRERGFMALELDDVGLIDRLRAWPVVRVVAAGSASGAGVVPAEAGEGQDGR
jgi:ketosteroid isomerase-like protein